MLWGGSRCVVPIQAGKQLHSSTRCLLPRGPRRPLCTAHLAWPALHLPTNVSGTLAGLLAVGTSPGGFFWPPGPILTPSAVQVPHTRPGACWAGSPPSPQTWASEPRGPLFSHLQDVGLHSMHLTPLLGMQRRSGPWLPGGRNSGCLETLMTGPWRCAEGRWSVPGASDTKVSSPFLAPLKGMLWDVQRPGAESSPAALGQRLSHQACSWSSAAAALSPGAALVAEGQ